MHRSDPDPLVADGDHAEELRRSLARLPRTIPPRWLYDDRGSELFDRITRLAEYYPTEAERQILTTWSTTFAARTGAHTLIELGSGTSDKTRTLLDAFVGEGHIRRFVPLDVSEATLVYAADVLSQRYPHLAVTPVVGDFTRHLGRLPTGETRLVAFLGGTIGNFYLEERRAFLGALGDVLAPGDWFLLGVDLLKPVDRILAAYDDPGGVTDAFIRNALTAINAELHGDFDVGNFEYVPLWDAREHRVDMRLRALEPETVTLRAVDLVLEVQPGEEIHVEISTKFDRATLTSELAEAGFESTEWFTDTAGDFALALSRRR